MHSIREWIVNWFVENTNLSVQEIKSKFEDNYLEKGWIDSLKFVNFIAEIEDNFNIHFSNAEFQNRNFSKINGLVKIIKKK